MNLRKFLLENEAVQGINTPSDYLYIKVLRFMLIIISSWPRKQIGEPESIYGAVFFMYFYLCVSIFVLFGSVLYVIIHMSELSILEIGHMYIATLMGIVNVLKRYCVVLMLCRLITLVLLTVVVYVYSVFQSRVITLTCSKKYRELAKEFLRKLHLFYHKELSEYAMKTHKMVHLVSHLFTLCLVAQMLAGLSLFNLIPMYSNYAAGRYQNGGLGNSTFEHSIYLSYPFSTSTEMKGYIFACIVHWFVSYLCSTWFCMFDLFLSLMVFNVWGHFKILINLLDDFPRPSSNSTFMVENGFVIKAEKYSEEELVQISERLKKCINYHREIVIFTNTMSDVFGPMLLVYYVFHQASGCLLLLECSQMTAQALMRYGPLTLILTQQLIQLSVIFELVGSESAKLKDAVYGVPWECMDMENRKVVAFFLMNVQEPIHVKALGVANVGVTSMAMIFKTSLSYFTFLRSM